MPGPRQHVSSRALREHGPHPPCPRPTSLARSPAVSYPRGKPGGRRPTLGVGPGEEGRAAYLVVLAVRVAAAAVRQDAALAVDHVARVALAALHAVVVAVALEADGGTARLAHAHAALVVAVGRAGDGCNARHASGPARSQDPARFPSGRCVPREARRVSARRE